MWCIPRGANMAIKVALLCDLVDPPITGASCCLLTETGDHIIKEDATGCIRKEQCI
jgi:hypothetical protein